jgi:alcohol dehydrogenase class IV
MATAPAKRQRVADAAPMVTVTIPPLLQFGGGCSLSLPAVLSQLGVRRPMVVTDAFIAGSSDLLEPILAALNEAGFSTTVFSDCVPDPTTDSVAAGLAKWREAPAAERADCMVGIGGGSSIDSAKAMALLALQPTGARMREFKVPAAPPAGLPTIAVPTTAGTGSEVTKVTIITDTETNEKMLCSGYNLLPRAALVDHTLTLSMPYRLTADSGLDSLCHAMEAYVSRKANFFSDVHALTAMRLIPANLRAVRATRTG